MNLTFLISCSSNDLEKKEIIIKESDITKECIGVNGMTCVGCEVTLEENISTIEGVVSVQASHSNNEAVIEFDSTKTDLNSITTAIKESGYETYNK